MTGSPGFRVDGEVAVVTGSSKGIGQAVAVALAEAGARVAVTARQEESLAETVALIEAAGGVALAVAWDVRDPDRAAQAVAEIEAKLGPLTLAVNNAGIAGPTPALDITPEFWRSVQGTNLDGLFWCCQAEGRAMIANGRGAIVNIASISATIANRDHDQAAYNTAKAGVVHLSKSLAVEWVRNGIRVNVVSPGYTATPMNSPERVGDLLPIWRDSTPMGRLAEPREIALPVLFLLSPAASYITGADLLVDGGYCCW
ncbi:SDR family oxidoreductase [Tessaracoccus sp. ZS01]|uniref:SDR family oxidoreductase n=1 Tax=Tessaracoccus sp. ZS01 TaxID=1906324 RepID=UPI00096C63D5|nr:SDR family oxidoreductase [Tessaracoccus sp. ZS01]MCG6566492.1 KR domain-containing protein [Tessaracoccus sp. ZS01]OMG58936.1 hypothetical protein BJN44_02460 [Tessaracoccus sp. ZS01]